MLQKTHRQNNKAKQNRLKTFWMHSTERFKLHFDYKLLAVFFFPWLNEFWFLFSQQSFCNRGGKKDTQRADAQVLIRSPKQTLQKVLLEIAAWLPVDWIKQSLSLSTFYLEQFSQFSQTYFLSTLSPFLTLKCWLIPRSCFQFFSYRSSSLTIFHLNWFTEMSTFKKAADFSY